MLGSPLGFEALPTLPPHVLQALPALPLELLAQALRRFRRIHRAAGPDIPAVVRCEAYLFTVRRLFPTGVV